MNSHNKLNNYNLSSLISVFHLFLTLLTITIILQIQPIQSQNLCQLISSKNASSQLIGNANSTIFINNFSSNKCLRVANFGHLSNSKVGLDECSWWKNVSRDQTFVLIIPNKSIPDGFQLQVPILGLKNELNCLTIKNDGALATENCLSSSLDQLWKFKPIRGGQGELQWSIQQVSSSKCLIPSRSTRRTSSETSIKLRPCNSYETEQIWKLCKLK